MTKSNSLTGIWHGLYSYPRMLDPVHFVATIISHGQSFSGNTHEARRDILGSPLALLATINGKLDGISVHFTKTYASHMDIGHNLPIAYDGELSSDNTEIEGTWSLPEWSGRFLMIRNSGITEAVIRQAYENV